MMNYARAVKIIELEPHVSILVDLNNSIEWENEVPQ